MGGESGMMCARMCGQAFIFGRGRRRPPGLVSSSEARGGERVCALRLPWSLFVCALSSLTLFRSRLPWWANAVVRKTKTVREIGAVRGYTNGFSLTLLLRLRHW